MICQDGLFTAAPNINSLVLIGWRVRQLNPANLQPRKIDFSVLTKLEHVNLTDLGLLIMPTFHSSLKTLRISKNAHLCLGNPSLSREVWFIHDRPLSCFDLGFRANMVTPGASSFSR